MVGDLVDGPRRGLAPRIFEHLFERIAEEEQGRVRGRWGHFLKPEKSHCFAESDHCDISHINHFTVCIRGFSSCRENDCLFACVSHAL